MSNKNNTRQGATADSRKDPFDNALTEVSSIALKKPGLRRTTEDLFMLAQQMGIDPFETLLHIADGNKMALSLDDEGTKPISPELRAMAARECLKYMYPTMKSAEISGPGGQPLPPQVVKILFEEASDVNKGSK